MKTVSVNDKLGHRARRHTNLLLCPNLGIVEYKGESIPPVARVVSKSYIRNGRWSHWTWETELQDDFELLPFSQDWETGKYFNEGTWAEAVKRLDNELEGWPTKLRISAAQLEMAIRAIWPEAAAEIDAAEAAFSDSGDMLADLFGAQQELLTAKQAERQAAAKVRQAEEAERTRQEAADIRARVERVTNLLESGQKISLADLQKLSA